MTHQEIGKMPVELTVQERDQHNNLTGGWYYASDEEIIEAARNLPGAEMRQEGPNRCKHGEVTMHVYNFGETACAGPIAEKKWVLVIPLADARRTEEE